MMMTAVPEESEPCPTATFVGRHRELAVLGEQLEQAFAGQGSIVMLSGEAGVGKTSIARRFALQARRRGSAVLSGCCFEGDWQPPYGPWVEALDEYARSSEPERLRQALGSSAATVAGLMPALRAACPDLPNPSTLSPDEERVRLYDAVIQFLVASARERPIVLVLDDLHWADPDSLRLLRYLGRFVERAPLLMIGAYRDFELEMNHQHPLAEVLAVLRRETGYRGITVRGLDPAEVAAFLARSTGRALPEGVVRAIYSGTSGNPFFVHEITRHLMEEDKLPRDEGDQSTELSIGDLGIPDAVRQIVTRRLSRLSEATNTLLRLAAGFSGGFGFEMLRELTDLPVETLLNCIDEALEAGLLCATDGTPPSYDFAHSIVRHTLYDKLNPDRRARLHRRIALAFERVYAGNALPHAAEIAAQYHASAGLPDAANGLPFALAAAEQARMACALEQAARLLRIARDLSAGGTPDVRAGVLCKLAVAEAKALMLDDAQRSVDEALQALSVAGAAPATRAEFLATIARALQDGGASRGVCESLVGRGLGFVGEEHGLLWARLALLSDRFAPISTGQVNASRWLGRDPLAVAIAREQGDEDDYAQMLGPFDRRTREETEAVLAMARRWQRPMAVMRALQVVVRDLLYLHGAFEDAAERCQELLEISERCGSIPGQAEALIPLAAVQAGLGDLDRARRTAQRASEVTARLGSAQALRFIAVGLECEIAYYLDGDWRALASAATELAGNPALAHTLVGLAVAATAAFSHSHAGNFPEARRLLAELTPVAEQVEPTTYGHNNVVVLAATAAWELAEVEFANVYRRQALDMLAAKVGDTVLGPHELTIARMSALLRNATEATVYFDRARRKLDERGQHHLRAIVDHDEALALIRARSGDRPRVLALLDAALTTFEALGMLGWTRRALERREIVVAGHRGSRGVKRGHPDGLTSREVEVLRLLAGGRTNREIAGELVVSLPTAQRHVANIYAKINARGRADATAYAVRHGIFEPDVP